MRRVRRFAPLVISLALVAAMGAVGLRVVREANDKADDTHLQDRLTQDRTLSSLTNQYFQFAFKEAFDFGAAEPWTFEPGDPGDAARLRSLASHSVLLQQGAALVGLDRQPLTTWSQAPGLPDSADPGFRPLISALLEGKPGLSSVMHVGGAPMVAVGVPVMKNGTARAVLIAFFRADQSPLQGYVAGLRAQQPHAVRMLVDSNGVVAASTDAGRIGRNFGADPPVADGRARKYGTSQFRRQGQWFTASSLPTGVGGWGGIVEEPTKSFFGATSTARHRADLALIGLLAIASAGLAVLNSRGETVRRRGEARFRSLVQNAADMITIVDAEGRVLYDSPAVERVLGYSPDDRLGRSGLPLVHPDDRSAIESALGGIVAGNTHDVVRVEVRVRRADGCYGWFEATASNMLADTSVRGIVVNLRDIRERRTFEERLTHQAFHDPLTSLPNRSLFQDRLAMALGRRRPAESQVAVLFLDLDRFKVVNDSLGHDMGDQLLVQVADRLRTCLRPEDTLARMSGDEFTVLIEDVHDLLATEQVANRLIDCLRSPFTIAGREVFVGVSIGIALGADDVQPEDLVRDADLAMYRAKERGRRRYEVFAADLGDQARNRLELEADLRRGIEQGQLRLHYQPEIDLAEGRLVGVEALVRWEHPTRGLLVPAQFIPIAEETGLIIPLGAWVLEQACLELRRWTAEHPDRPPMRMSVNVSGRQLEQHRRLVNTVASVLQETAVDPTLLTLELTESVLMDNTELTVTTLRELRALGVEIAIDDFGTGYSSLNYLKHFPISTLKLDRSFVHGIGNDDADAAIARSAIGLAHALHLRVTAEGIELDEQLTQLRDMGCDRGQGFHFSRPVPADELDALVEELEHYRP
jgi:diguanylate cyclase (GGDEF)-like protein/PAS domain S-box-containing protein